MVMPSSRTCPGASGGQFPGSRRADAGSPAYAPKRWAEPPAEPAVSLLVQTAIPGSGPRRMKVCRSVRGWPVSLRRRIRYDPGRMEGAARTREAAPDLTPSDSAALRFAVHGYYRAGNGRPCGPSPSGRPRHFTPVSRPSRRTSWRTSMGRSSPRWRNGGGRWRRHSADEEVRPKPSSSDQVFRSQ